MRQCEKCGIFFTRDAVLFRYETHPCPVPRPLPKIKEILRTAGVKKFTIVRENLFDYAIKTDKPVSNHVMQKIRQSDELTALYELVNKELDADKADWMIFT